MVCRLCWLATWALGWAQPSLPNNNVPHRAHLDRLVKAECEDVVVGRVQGDVAHTAGVASQLTNLTP